MATQFPAVLLIVYILNMEQIKRYYAFKVKHADVYTDLKPSNEANIFKHNILTVFPNRDQLGRRILVLELGSKYTERRILQYISF